MPSPRQLFGMVLVLGGLGSSSDLSWTVQQAPAPHVRGAIVVTPAIVSEQYCGGDDEFGVLKLRFRFDLTNLGKTPVVLYLGSPAVIRVNVAADSTAMRAGNYETEFFPSNYSTASVITIDPKFLVSIKPDQTYSLSHPPIVPLTITSGGLIVPGIVGPGRHVMRLTLQLWPGDPSVLANWATRVGEKGVLRTEPLVTKDIPIVVERSPKSGKCD